MEGKKKKKKSQTLIANVLLDDAVSEKNLK